MVNQDHFYTGHRWACPLLIKCSMVFHQIKFRYCGKNPIFHYHIGPAIKLLWVNDSRLGFILLVFPLPLDFFSSLKVLESQLVFMAIVSDLFEGEELRLIPLLGPGAASCNTLSNPPVSKLSLRFWAYVCVSLWHSSWRWQTHSVHHLLKPEIFARWKRGDMERWNFPRSSCPEKPC